MEEKRGEEQKGRRGQREDGEGISVVNPPCPPPPAPRPPRQLLEASHSAPAPEAPQPAGPGGWTEQEQAPPPGSPPGGEQGRKEGKKAGGREQGRKAGGREEEERGRREGGTERDAQTKNRGAGAGKGCREGAGDRGGPEVPGVGAGGEVVELSSLLRTSQAEGGGVGVGVDSLPQGRELGCSELGAAWLRGRQAQGLWGNMGKKLLTVPHPLPRPWIWPLHRPALPPAPRRPPSPNTPWARKQSHPSRAGNDPPFPSWWGFPSQGHLGLAPSSPSRYAWQSRGAGGPRGAAGPLSPQPHFPIRLLNCTGGQQEGRPGPGPWLAGHSLGDLGKGQAHLTSRRG